MISSSGNRALSVGETTQCNRIRITNGSITCRDMSSTGVAVVLDRCAGFQWDNGELYVESTMRGRALRTTANASSVEIKANVSGGFIEDVAATVIPAINMFADPYLATGTTGFSGDSVATSNCTVSLESAETTPNIRTGTEAIHLKASASGLTLSRAVLTFPTAIVNAFNGKTVTLGAWVYLSNSTGFAVQTYPTAAKLVPSLSLYDGSSFTSSTAICPLQPGKWNYVTITKTINAAATYLKLYAAVIGTTDGSTTSDGTEYMILDSMALCYGTVSTGGMLHATNS